LIIVDSKVYYQLSKLDIMASEVINISLLADIVKELGGQRTAAIMGVSYNTLKSILSGTICPRVDSIYLLAKERGIPFSDFLIGEGHFDPKAGPQASIVLFHFIKEAREELSTWNPKSTDEVILKMRIKGSLDNAMAVGLNNPSKK
jgi:hypothetical protein